MKNKPALHKKIFLGMIVGIVGGIAVQYSGLPKETIDTITLYVKPVGDIFLRMIFMMVMPLILSALALGVAELGDLKKIGKVGLRTLAYTIIVSTISVVIGITMVKVFEPGKSISEENRQMLIDRFSTNSATLQSSVASVKARSIGEILTVIVPKNVFEDMTKAFDPAYTGGGILAIMFFALMIGIALSISDQEKVDTFKRFLEGMYEVVMKVIGFGMKLAPFGVASLLFTLTANMGFSILAVLSKFVLVVLLSLCIHQFVTYSLLLKFLGKMSPLFFFRNIKEVMLTAFSTSSSNATLPTAIRVTIDNLKLPKDITNFVLTIGSTANQNGTALYEGVTVLFLAQCFGIHLELSQQIVVVLMSILGGIGTAGVPSGSLPIIMMILISIGVPGESIAIIYGVDRFLDMCRTVLNVTGDITAAVYVSRLEQPAPTVAS
ncbi:MAG TPA: dicarboxylate/amino acid:cation symporter [Bacteroidota bacterium]|nr:dicarboxylate/amino acid:cation symporter [Bacteroidota bacterium]